MGGGWGVVIIEQTVLLIFVDISNTRTFSHDYLLSTGLGVRSRNIVEDYKSIFEGHRAPPPTHTHTVEKRSPSIAGGGV